jgi:hypothetical protein
MITGRAYLQMEIVMEEWRRVPLGVDIQIPKAEYKNS